ncbi:hypothetical protein PanWU01x14_118510 [Parasponia andersonii]|uniref:Uncharacterized protein n=1 Tax=Parasponia andersonii TaxID=3476 RepID=A0A2P5CVT1_PARAD|nr:hypothetical protein PanWU01x14_118510 [Parasponia andersonii]
MQTVGRMNDVHGIIWEKPPIETPWHRGDEARPKLAPLFLLLPLIEARKRPEDGVEIVAGEIVEEQLESWWLLVRASAGGFNGVKNKGPHRQCVGAGGAAQVCYSQTLWEDGTTDLYNALF